MYIFVKEPCSFQHMADMAKNIYISIILKSSFLIRDILDIMVYV